MSQGYLGARSGFRLGRVRGAFLAVLAVAGLAACEEVVLTDPVAGTYYGAPVRIGAGSARTYLMRTDDGKVTSLGIELTDSALVGLPQTMVMLKLPLPAEAASTQYTFAMLDWNPHGHDPAQVYTVPHFDFHFYMAPEAEVSRIPGGPDAVLPEARFVPTDYVSPGNAAVPAMGVHWIDSRAGELNGRAFDQTLLYGYTGGRMIFVEPMITRAFLETRPSFSAPVKLPQAFQRPGLYPHRYSIRYDATRRLYRISLDELTSH